MIRAESGFNVRAVSPKGAQGLMQLMPKTASQLGVQNAFDPQANVEGGTRYLRELLERYDFDLIKALAAYNAGPRRVEQYGGVPPYYETKAYVARIVRDFNKKKLAAKSAAPPAAQKKAATKSAATHAPATKVHKTPETQPKAKNSRANERIGFSHADSTERNRTSHKIERTTPPSARNAAPFVAEHSGLQRNATNAPISLGSIMRFSKDVGRML